jgi:hypothetical protein
MKKVLAKVSPFLPLSFMLLFYFLVEALTEEEEMHQPFNEEDENFIKVAIVEDKAYWVIQNVLYQADIIDEEIDKENASPVDAFSMDFKEVNQLMNILDNMQDWKN